ncbi:MAG: hypothetical protein JXB04_11540 [Kiritimatiellae bacterium]|nr:hypothetical protein [Kiritimatiellia bacterium]
MESLIMRRSDSRPGSAIAQAAVLALVCTAAGSKAQVLTAAYDFAEPVIEVRGDYARVTVAGCASLSRIGEPIVPLSTARLLLPAGYRVVGVRADTPVDPVTLEGSWTVEFGRTPVRQPRREEGGAPIAADDEPDPAIYGSSAPYPGDWVELAGVQSLNGHNIALIRVYPVRYVPAQGELFFAPRIEITLTLAPGSSRERAHPAARTRSRTATRVADFVDNPETLEDAAAGGTKASPAPLNGYDYLLITPTNLLSAFQPLLDRKSADGLAVQTESIESITTNYAGSDLAEKVRHCIRHAYTNWGVEYVLLGGDITNVPCRYAYVDMDLPELDSYIPCDLYYACLDGSWNFDGDGRWGEPTDGEGAGDVDLLAEVIVGRAPVDTPAEAALFVEKALRYETNGHPHAEDVLLTAQYLGYYAPGVHAQGGDMFDPMLPLLNDHVLTWLDDRPETTAQWAAADAIAALNSNPHIVMYAGHGDVDAVMRLEISDLDAVTNAELFLAHSVSCNAGEFDNDQFSPDCIGEEFVKRHSGGAFAAVFNSREGWFDPQEEWRYSGEFQIEFFDQLIVQGQTRAGQASQLAKHAMLGQVETSGIMPYRWCYYGITFFGDPHVPVKQAGCRLTVDPVSGGTPAGMVLKWSRVPGRLYSPQWSAQVGGTYSNIADDLTVGIYTDAVHAAGQRGFYRILSRP